MLDVPWPVALLVVCLIALAFQSRRVARFTTSLAKSQQALQSLKVKHATLENTLEVQAHEIAALERELQAQKDTVAALEEELRRYPRVKWERDWYLFFYQCYASWERYRSYGVSNHQTQILGRELPGFLDIQALATRIACPPAKTAAVGGDYLYFGARMLPLSRGDGSISSIYAMSYHGSHEFAHGESSFDVFVTP